MKIFLLPLLLAMAASPAAWAQDAPVAEPLPAPLLYWSTDHLGVDVLVITPELRSHYGAPATSGVLVAAVTPDTPADAAGIRVGDVIIEINGAEVDSTARFRAVVRQQPAATLQVTVVRYGELQIFTPVYQQSRSRGRIVIQLPANDSSPGRDIQIELPDLQQEMQVIRDQMQRLETELDRLANTLNHRSSPQPDFWEGNNASPPDGQAGQVQEPVPAPETAPNPVPEQGVVEPPVD